MIFVNFKTYRQSTGKNALVLAGQIKKVSDLTKVKIIPVVQASDIREVKESTGLEVWAQKIDPVSFGAHTGAVLPEAVKEDGALGVFLNHSEARFESDSDLEKAVSRAKEVGLKTLVFAKDIEELEKVAHFSPDFVAYEPPELIGSKETSVARAKPEIISQAVLKLKDFGVPLVVGAGISDVLDVKKSLELGAAGIAVASSVVLADNPFEKLKELSGGFS